MSSVRLKGNYQTPVNWSLNNLSKDSRFTFKQGLFVPFRFIKSMATDKFETKVQSLLQSNPFVAPLMGALKLRFSFFKSDDSNYYGWLDNNERVDADKWLSRRRHYISSYYRQLTPADTSYVHGSILPFVFSSGAPGSTVTIDNKAYRSMCVQPGSLLDFVGIPQGFVCPTTHGINDNFGVDYFAAQKAPDVLKADRILVYLDTVRNYLVNNQYPRVPYLYVQPLVYSDADTPDYLVPQTSLKYVSLTVLDFFFKMLRMEPDGVDIYRFVWSLYDNSELLAKHEISSTDVFGLIEWFSNLRYGGLFCSQFEADFMQNLFQKVGVDNVAIRVDEETNSIIVTDIRFANKTQHVNEDISVAGGRPDDVNRMIWHSDGYGKLDIPAMISTYSIYVNPHNVVSVSNTYQSPDTGSQLGQLASLVNQHDGDNARDFDFESKWESTVMCCVTLIPYIDYSQGIEVDNDKLFFADDFKPQYNQLGFQDKPYYLYNALPDGIPIDKSSTDPIPFNNSLYMQRSVGKTVAWSELRSDVNRVYGEFGNMGIMSYWVLTHNMQREDDGVLRNNDFSPYINPADYQYVFEVTRPTFDNWFLQVSTSIQAVRPISNQLRPTLE